MTTLSTTGSDIIRDYLRNYPNINHTALARTICQHHPGLYRNEESVRRMVRRIVKEEEFSSKPEGRTPFNFPEAVTENQASTFFLPKRDKRKILTIADPHIPYYSRPSFELAIEIGIKRGITTVFCLGDFFDFPTLSRFVRNPMIGNLAEELEMGREIWSEIRKIYGDDVEIFWLFGNHDYHFERYLWTDAPLLLGIEDFQLSSVLNLEELNITTVPDTWDIRVTDNLTALHGHQITYGTSTNPAYALFRKFKDNAIMGHVHRPSHYPARTGTGRIISTWTVACLSLLRPQFQPVNEWMNGCMYIETDEEEFQVENFQFINNKIYHA